MAQLRNFRLSSILPLLSAFKLALLVGSLLIVLYAGLSCRNKTSTENAKDKIVFMAGYKPQANLPFVAAYVAHEKGYFQKQGLDVEIRHTTTGGNVQLLLNGDVDFTTADATSVLKRKSDPQIPIVAFVLFGQRGQQAYIALDTSGIKTVKDWEGKIFGYKTSVPPDYLAILKANNIDRSTIKEVSVGFDPRVLTEGKVDILAVYKSNEPDLIRNLPGGGFNVTMWEPSEYGVPEMGLTYITHQKLTEERPEIVKKFLKATLKALEFVMQEKNMEETLDIVLKYAPDAGRNHQRFMLRSELRDSTGPITDQQGVGWMNTKQWESLYNHLLEYESIPKAYDFKTAFTNEFLSQVYDNKRLIWP